MSINYCFASDYNVYTQAVSIPYLTRTATNPNKAGTLTSST